MSGTHTPGPWKVLPLGTHKYYGTVVDLGEDAGELEVWGTSWRAEEDRKPSRRQMEHWGNPSPADVSELTCDNHYENAADCANARLIAAAPELLEALREIRQMAADEDQRDFDVVRLEGITSAAIAKAEGREVSGDLG